MLYFIICILFALLLMTEQWPFLGLDSPVENHSCILLTKQDNPCLPPSDSIRSSYKEDYFHTDTVMLTYTTVATNKGIRSPL